MQRFKLLPTLSGCAPAPGPDDLFDLGGEADSEAGSDAGGSERGDAASDGGFGMVEHEDDAATILYSTLKGRCAALRCTGPCSHSSAPSGLPDSRSAQRLHRAAGVPSSRLDGCAVLHGP